MPVFYDVYTDANPDEVTDIGLKVFIKWVMFALGKTSLNGKRLHSPTGRYASSIRVERQGPQIIAIIADADIAPEADILEHGHGPIDLKKYPNLRGRSLPIHRGLGTANAAAWGSKGYGPAFVGSPFAKRSNNMWAKARSKGFTGVAKVPSKVTSHNSNSWVIPAMSAYSPTQALAEMVRSGDFNQ